MNNDTTSTTGGAAETGPRRLDGGVVRPRGRREHPVRVVPDTYCVRERGGAPGLLRHPVGFLSGDLDGCHAGGCVNFVPERGVLQGRHSDEWMRVREAVFVEHGANRLKSGGIISSCSVWTREEVCSIIIDNIHQTEGRS